MSSHDTVNPNGGVSMGDVMESPIPNDDLQLFKELSVIIIYPTTTGYLSNPFLEAPDRFGADTRSAQWPLWNVTTLDDEAARLLFTLQFKDPVCFSLLQ